ncbi:MAG: ABC transporter ATP-binding protein [Thermoplasmata archaeon]
MACEIKIDNITKYYGETLALDDVSLSVNAGSIYGILGPNGSGKTTLMKIIVSMLDPTSGFVSVCDYDPKKDSEELKKIIGYIPESPMLYESLTPSEFISFIGSIRNIDSETLKKRSETLAKAFEITSHMDEFIGSLSFGTKQKIAIISAILHDPKILIVDEGMNGLDPRSARIFKDLMINMKSSGKIVIFSTHIMEIAENICDSVAILYHGKIVANGTMDEIKNENRTKNENLEDIFLKLTDSGDISNIVKTLRDNFEV